LFFERQHPFSPVPDCFSSAYHPFSSAPICSSNVGCFISSVGCLLLPTRGGSSFESGGYSHNASM
jgi:hypothetical protein